MIKEINFEEYKSLFTIAYRKSVGVRVNCDIPKEDNLTRYFKSKEGISYLKDCGYMAGLCRFKNGSERITDIHQEHRISKGGYFLECYDTKLVSLYEKNGFGIVGRIPFVEECAHLDWKTKIPQKPDVVFLSLYKKDIKTSENYDKMFDYAASKHNFRLFMSRPQEDKLIKDFHNLESVLKFCNKTQEDITSVIDLPKGMVYGLKHEMNAYIDMSILPNFKNNLTEKN